MWHFTVLINLAQDYHDSDAALLTSVSVISATISSSLKTRISKSSDPTRSWKGKESHIFTATSEHSRISIDKTKNCTILYTLRLLPESFSLPRIRYSGSFFPLGQSPASVSEEKVATTDCILPCGLHIVPEYELPPSNGKHAPAQCLLWLQMEALFQMPETSSHGQGTGESVPDTALCGLPKKLTPRGSIRITAKAKGPSSKMFRFLKILATTENYFLIWCQSIRSEL